MGIHVRYISEGRVGVQVYFWDSNGRVYFWCSERRVGLLGTYF